MPENLKSLRRRIRSVKNTGKITRAMEMVSAAKLRRNQQQMQSGKPFLRKLEEVLGRLAQSETAKANPLFEVRADGKRLLVLFTSDRGLCGAFNAQLNKMAARMLREQKDLLVYAIGRKGRDFMKKYFPDRLIGELIDLGGTVNGPVADELGAKLLGLFESKEYREIHILGPEFLSAVLNRPRLSQFLPVQASGFGVSEVDADTPVDYILEPSPERVFESLLPRYLKSKIFLTFAEAFTAEHSARMMAMNNATKNCKELAGALTLRANKIRQAAITTEIIEIVSGAEAAKGS